MSEILSSPDPGLSGKNALVTGGSRGIGRAIVERLAASGMDVTFTYVSNGAAAEKVIAENPGAKITAVKVDARDSAAVAKCIEEMIERVETVDVLVNNAGVIRDNLLPMLEDEDLETVFETNIEGVFHFCR
ncbi:MAG: SDR family NAD(P)-dependent oxidoreductase, partial [Verrucomicrobiota bacterium]